MIYKEEFHPKIKSDLKKIDKNVLDKIKTVHLDKILNNPLDNDYLSGKLSHIKSYHFRQNKVEYRIAYEVLDDDKIIFYYMVAKRENFYKNLESRLS